MSNTLYKKLLGTSILVFLVSFIFLGGTSFVYAQIINVTSLVSAEGVVTSKSASAFSFSPTDTTPLNVSVADNTIFSGGGSLSSLEVGDFVKVTGRKSGDNILARVVRITGNTYGSGGGNTYGNGGPVILRNAEVLSKGANSLTVSMSGADTTLTVNDSTRFIRTSLGDLQPGDNVQIIGSDDGSSNLAKVVIAR